MNQGNVLSKLFRIGFTRYPGIPTMTDDRMSSLRGAARDCNREAGATSTEVSRAEAYNTENNAVVLIVAWRPSVEI